MAMSFGPETPLLWYGPRAHADPGGRNDRVWLGWPTWAFRVVAPEFRNSRLNALQKAVLGILRASRLTAAELSERLGIHRELAAFVVADLQGQQRVDEDWKVTQDGIRLLEAETAESAKLAPAWMFRDALSGDLLPFAAPTLEYARTVPDEGGSPVLDLGSTGSPWQQRPWTLRAPREAFPEMPVPAEILKAARQSRRSHRLWQQVGTHEDDLDEPNVETVQLDRLTNIEEEPQPVYLVTFLYTPKGAESDGDWYACEFFGRGHDQSLRQSVIDAAESDEKLAQLLDRHLFAFTWHRSFAGFQTTDRQCHQQAARLLVRVLTIGIENHGVVAKPLREMLLAYLKWHDVGSSGASRFVLIECRRALEVLFVHLVRHHPLEGIADLLSHEDDALNETVLQSAAKQLGLTQLPGALRRVSAKRINAVNDRSSLRSLAAATLLRAKSDATHPLALAAKDAPNILERVERVAKHGGEAAHEDRGVDGAPLEQVVQDVLDVSGLLLGFPTRKLEELTTDA